jgi:hypothetical protein
MIDRKLGGPYSANKAKGQYESGNVSRNVVFAVLGLIEDAKAGSVLG